MTLLLNIAANFTEVIEPIGSILGSVGAVFAGWAIINDIRSSDENDIDE